MSTGALDPLIHDPEQLRIVATLAALPDGDALSVTRLQDMIGLTPGSQITRLPKLEHAGYVRTEKTGDDRAQTTVALTCDGRAALDRYTAVLRQGELFQAARDPPDLTVLSARVSLSRGKRARPEHKPGPAPGQGAWPHRRGWTRGGSS
jgi:DNA-binding MarR family transcriptional regulator